MKDLKAGHYKTCRTCKFFDDCPIACMPVYVLKEACLFIKWGVSPNGAEGLGLKPLEEQHKNYSTQQTNLEIPDEPKVWRNTLDNFLQNNVQ